MRFLSLSVIEKCYVVLSFIFLSSSFYVSDMLCFVIVAFLEHFHLFFTFKGSLSLDY